MNEIEKTGGESLEEMLNRLEKRKGKHKMDMTKFLPVGWSRLSDEQRKMLQEMIYKFIDENKARM
jgi:hypothetical protein